MITILDLKVELANLTILRGRTPETPRAERAGSAARLAPYRDGAIFASKSACRGAWERHPNGDELVQVVDGAATLHLITEDGPQSFALSAGMLAVVPRGGMAPLRLSGRGDADYRNARAERVCPARC